MKKLVSVLLSLAIMAGLCAAMPLSAAAEDRDAVFAEAVARLFPVEGSHAPDAALELLLPLAESGDAEAQYYCGWIYDFDELISTLNEYSTIKVGKLWKIIIKFILPICITFLWLQGIYYTLSEADPTSIAIRGILLALLIILPIIFTKLPAKDEDYYKT